ncbi:hypothetical protein CDD81_4973 [Ophiocordyceps australis]|uniref:MARVEL domain-containing protein n=1 Tax=Ophiocordyceps australis TaxID=1399860 RepID=A0A2C5XIQ6_9HYPO|nr:hypothetical protein CDD81_4973 [Ophiocordyceps australis]
MSTIVNISIRAFALLWTLLITALIGNVIASNNNGSMSAINYAMFVASLSWVVSLYGIASALMTSIASPIVMVVLDALTLIFSFVSAIVLAAKLRAVDCGNLSLEHLPQNWIALGSKNVAKRCREIQASTAFMWFLFACFCASLFFSFMDSRSGGGFGGLSLGRRRGASKPSMSQVGA